MSAFQLIGLFGPAKSGKDLVADWFVDHGFVKIAYADSMKRFVHKAFSIGPLQLWGESEERNKAFLVDNEWWYKALQLLRDASHELTSEVLKDDRVTGYLKLIDWVQWLRLKYPTEVSARIILQTMGTEWGRAINPHLWTNYTYEVIGKIISGAVSYTQQGGPVEKDAGGPQYAGAIIPDHRFINEVKLAQEKGTYVIRLRRLALEGREETIGLAGHQSETEGKTVPDSAFDMVLEVEEGTEKVYERLATLYEKAPWSKSTPDSSSL